MQIKELILYGKNGQVKRLRFNLGKVNIITGKSRTGKSALGDIIDYCLCSSDCDIADGIIRQTVDWYALIIQLDSEQMLVARQNPGLDAQTCTACYFEVGTEVSPPESVSFHSNINRDGLLSLLNSKLGIGENKNIPNENESRPQLSTSIRHALYYCIQSQGEIASHEVLFHKQAQDYFTSSFKDTFPFLLGAIDSDAYALEQERKYLKREIRLLEGRLEELDTVAKSGQSLAASLISEARVEGLIDPSEIIDLSNPEQVMNVLSKIAQWNPSSTTYDASDSLCLLQDHLQQAQMELREISDSIDEVCLHQRLESSCKEQVGQQKARLESIGLFEKITFDAGKCPLCAGDLEQETPNICELKRSIIALDKALESVSKEQSNTSGYLSQLYSARNSKLDEIRQLQSQIDGTYEQERELQKERDSNVRRARVVGKICFWLATVRVSDENTASKNLLAQLKIRLDEINQQLDPEERQGRIVSALSLIQTDMTRSAQELQLEHSGYPYRIDMSKATVVVDTKDRSIPLKKLGSGSNWVGVHLITFFALHNYFISRNRPVPRFLFLDQPSQVFFPAENDEQRTDWDEVRKLYNFIFKKTQDAEENLQVIIVDHADFSEQAFTDCIIDKWDSKNGLIPEDWYLD